MTKEQLLALISKYNPTARVGLALKLAASAN